jgi:hypothetical protein
MTEPIRQPFSVSVAAEKDPLPSFELSFHHLDKQYHERPFVGVRRTAER